MEEILNKEEETQEETQEESRQESSKEYNFRQLRERAKKAEEKLAEYERMQKEMAETQDDNIDIDDDDFVRGNNIKKYIKELKKDARKTRDELNKWHQQQAQVTAELRLKSMYPDFDKVLTQKNLDKFEEMYPEEYSIVMSNPDLYSKGKAFYNMFTRYGIVKKDENLSDRIHENTKKPKSANTGVGYGSDSPLSKVHDYERRVLSAEERRAVVEQAKKFAKG